MAFFFRSLLEFLEGAGSDGKYRDKDIQLDTGVADAAAAVN